LIKRKLPRIKSKSDRYLANSKTELDLIFKLISRNLYQRICLRLKTLDMKVKN